MGPTRENHPPPRPVGETKRDTRELQSKTVKALAAVSR
jgi:hypothetical protein